MSELARVLEAARAYEDQAERTLALAERVRRGDAVRRIIIHLDRRSPTAGFRQFGPRLVPIFNYFQAALVLFEDRVLSSQQVLFVAREMLTSPEHTVPTLANSLQDLLRRGRVIASAPAPSSPGCRPPPPERPTTRGAAWPTASPPPSPTGSASWAVPPRSIRRKTRASTTSPWSTVSSTTVAPRPAVRCAARERRRGGARLRESDVRGRKGESGRASLYPMPDATLESALAERGLPVDHPLAIDLALALALARHDRGALAAFDRDIAPTLRAALRRFDRGPDFIDEAVQRTRVKLLVPGDRPPRILEYRGRGSLKKWITVVAVREALLMLRAAARELPGDDDLMQVAFTEPVLARWRQAHKRELSASFRAAMKTLEVRERNLLRLCFVEGVATEEVARLFSVHRTTAFRWLRDARAKLLDRTRDEFLARAGIAASEVDSVMRSLAESLSVAW